MSVIAWIFIGLLAGWLATRIMGGRGGLMRNQTSLYKRFHPD